jgi:hypothetical protein
MRRYSLTITDADHPEAAPEASIVIGTSDEIGSPRTAHALLLTLEQLIERAGGIVALCLNHEAGQP